MLVGALFDDIYIQRTDKDGNETELIKIPITYAAKDKMLARVLEDPAIDRPTATLPLPMISFEMGAIKYDGPRKLHTTGRTVNTTEFVTPSTFLAQYNPVPYNIEFKVYVYVKNTEDGTKIIEQILPFFTPDWTTSVKIIPEMGITMDIPVILHNVNSSDNYDKDFNTRRAIIWTLDLVLKGYLYGPIKQIPIIKFTNTSFYIATTDRLRDSIGTVPIEEMMLIEPGLTANGEPTSDPTLSIPVREIEANSDYGYLDFIYHGFEIDYK